MEKRKKKQIVNFLYFIILGLVLHILFDAVVVDSYEVTSPTDFEILGLSGDSYQRSITIWENILDPFDEITDLVFGDYYGVYLLTFLYLSSYWIFLFLNEWKNR